MSRASFRRWLDRLFSGAARSARPGAFRPRMEGLEDRVTPATFVVNSTVDGLGAGTLRRAILDANNLPGADDIQFNITGSGVQTIRLTSALPAITDTVTIDGSTQAGYTGLPLIFLNGASAKAGANGLTVSGPGADGTVIKSLVISRFAGNGILLLSNDNVVENCFIGTNPVGSAAPGNGGSGIAILGSSSGNTIGGTTDFSGNLISGNAKNGIVMQGIGVSGNLVQNNSIGTDLSFAFSLPNKQDGVAILQGANNNFIGAAGQVNYFAGNGRNGVRISGAGTEGNDINNNVIFFNTQNGIRIESGAANNSINTLNVISANKQNGILITGAGTSGNTVTGNTIGTNFTSDAIGNKQNGVLINGGATGNTIGGATPEDGNFISANGGFGVNITGSGTNGNTVSANNIGTDLTGTFALANKSSGVQISAGASGNTIGGATTDERNVISGNKAHGVIISGASGNTVDGNYIGVNVDGTGPIANKAHGVMLTGKAANNVIGGAIGNVISGNAKNGILISTAGTTGNLIQTNSIGLDAAGTVAIGNNFNGIQVNSGANGNTIDSNTISGNFRSGVLLNGASLTTIRGNKIGTDVTATTAVGNFQQGVFVTNGGANNRIGGVNTSDANIIANNFGVGVLIGSDPSTGLPTNGGVGNSILGNSIFNNILLGIKLGKKSGSVNQNDNKDTDKGPNNRQNFPQLITATIVGTQVEINYSINSVPNTTLLIEFFAGAAGQGENLLGSVTVTTDALGLVVATTSSFDYDPSLGAIITATATNLTTNDTSEFTPGIPAV